MSPQSPRIPTQDHASGGAADAAYATSTGRHRRPESLADVSVRNGPRVTMNALDATPLQRSSAEPPRRSARHQRPARGGRHAVTRPPAGGPAAERAAAGRPPATGSHRAPGTLPIESWLLLGRTRQGALLASLVAVGVLLLALPAEQRRDSIDAVNAAAQAVAGVQTKAPAPTAPASPAAPAKENKESSKDSASPGKGTPEKAAPKPTADVPGVPPAAEATDAAGPAGPEKPSAGPGQSLRTTGNETVALTFDDGPDPVQTPRILRLLDRYQVKAVFCVVGAQVERHPEIVRQIVADGHTLCNHTWDHSLTIGKDKPAEIKADLDRTNAAILAADPAAKIPFFRAPGGNFTDRLVGVAGDSGMTSLYWQVDPRDWDHPDKETEPQHIKRVIDDIREQVRPGSIVLSHDFNQPATITAYEQLLPWLTENFAIGIPDRTADRADAPPAADDPEPTGTPEPDSTEAPAATRR
ncbi:polysaccharide deacetylase family protein [Actinoplanes sp. M2I2]|uniref:polysaccharide deacetylase family protein n=1 Tax=Actinoplanes sp. M2I2 TaxID=1734444 RepID=UPI002020B92E|nr:polysaccharide deacetylase family protein [Actinoplanes sp. M2I2]